MENYQKLIEKLGLIFKGKEDVIEKILESYSIVTVGLMLQQTNTSNEEFEQVLERGENIIEYILKKDPKIFENEELNSNFSIVNEKLLGELSPHLNDAEKSELKNLLNIN